MPTGIRMRVLLVVVLGSAFATSAPATPPQSTQAKSPVIVDAKGDVVRFYGVPMNLKPADLKRYRYKVGHFSAEGDTYTFYTIKTRDGVEVDVQFHKGKLVSVRTSSPNAVGPRGVGVGSPLSAVEVAWPEGAVTFGIQENSTYVVFEAAEPGFMPNVDYYFDPKDMPPHAFEGEIWKKRTDIVPKNISVKSIGIFPREFPEETYDFLAVFAGPCAPKIGVRMSAKQQAACKRMTPKRRYRGTLFASGNTFLFAPAGQPACAGASNQPNCAALEGNMWIRPDYDAWCPRLYQLEFVGRRNVLPRPKPAYRIMVDEILAYRELDDLPNEPASCVRPWRSK